MKLEISEFLQDLSRKDIQLFVDNGKLKISLSEGAENDAQITLLISQLKQRKQEVIDYLSQSKSTNKNTVIRNQKSSALSPLSFGQQRLWFLDRLETSSSSYNLSTAMWVKGSLDISAFDAAIETLLERHEILRSVYPNAHEMQILPTDSIRCQHLDLSNKIQPANRNTIQELALAESLTPFQLGTGPNIRFRLIKTDVNERVLLVTMHHIVSDGWSIGIMTEELSVIYNSIVNQKIAQLPVLEIKYSDFCFWQKDTYSHEFLAKDLQWWQSQLVDAPLRIELPADLPRPPIQSYNGGVESIVIPPHVVNNLQTICRRENVTLYMLSLALFGVLISRHTSQKDLLIGSPFSGRRQQELEGLLGVFTNTLPMRLQTDQNQNLTDYLKTVRAFCLGAYEHQALPFEKLVDALKPERDVSYSPIMQVIFGFQNSPNHNAHPRLNLQGLEVKPFDVERQAVSVDLEVHLWEYNGSIECEFVYNTKLYHRNTIKRMCRHYATLLEKADSHSDQSPLLIPMLTDNELSHLHRLQQSGNRVENQNNNEVIVPPQERSLVSQFEQMAMTYPAKTALVLGNRKLSFEELNQRANNVALQLRQTALQGNEFVAVYCDKSVEMIISLLAIVKSGAAYIPLDVSTPLARIKTMLSDTQTRIILTQEKYLNAVNNFDIAELSSLLVDANSELSNQDSAEHQPESLNPVKSEHLAYAIFTSGSTGMPKAVPITHANVLNMLEALQPIVEFGADDTWTLFHSYSFDYSVWEIWGCLLYGGTLVIVPDDARQDSALLYDLLKQQSVTILNLTPSNMQRLLPQVTKNQGFPDSLRALCCGGEAFPNTLVTPLTGHGIPVWNFYGPTEATVWSSIYRIKPEDSALAAIPIGTPLTNYQLQILDDQKQAVPLGVVGELYISGAGISTGYVNRPELNSSHFIMVNGSLSYRTGDLAKYDLNGNIEYLGRRDFQVKIRGFRIELGEIESLLTQHTLISKAVIAKHQDSGSEYLVAYVVFNSGETLGTDEIRDYLRQSLPEYMVPSKYAVLSELPISTNGKVDRKNLPLVQTQRSTSTQYVAPTNALEEDIVAIWKTVLDIDKVGIKDNFFDLGGHSIRLTQVQEQLASKGHITELVALFRYPTPALLAASLQTKPGAEANDLKFESAISNRVQQQKAKKRQRNHKVNSKRFS